MFELGRIVIISYITYMLVYLVISYIVYRIKYDTKKVEIEKYDNNLKELFKIYKSEDNLAAESEIETTEEAAEETDENKDDKEDMMIQTSEIDIVVSEEE